MDRLLYEMFRKERWEEMIAKADAKGINKTILRRMSTPSELKKIYYLIKTEQYEIAPPRKILIPKDKPGEFREVKANEAADRIILTLINDCIMDIFSDMIHPTSKAYQKGTGCQEVVKACSNYISTYKYNVVGYKDDLTKFFDSLPIQFIDRLFDIWEARLGCEYGTHPVINMIRKYYHSDWLFDVDGTFKEEYTSMKQGCALASAIANMCLYDIDEEMSKMCEFYVRYSDDLLLIGKNADKAQKRLKEMLNEYGLTLNPKKVEKLYKDKFFKFLGFNIKGNTITLSSSRVKSLQKEITSRTLDKANTTAENARRSLIHYLYEGDYNWATSCFSIINCKEDINEINNFIMDCLRACDVRDQKRKAGKKVGKIKITEIGGLGANLQQKDKTIQRGKGSSVKTIRTRTRKEIDKYVTTACLVADYQQSKTLFQAVVRGLQ